MVKKLLFLFLLFFALSAVGASIKDYYKAFDSLDNSINVADFKRVRNEPTPPVIATPVSPENSFSSGGFGFQNKIIFLNWKRNNAVPVEFQSDFERIERLANAGILHLGVLRSFQKKVSFNPVVSTMKWVEPIHKSFSVSVPKEN